MEQCAFCNTNIPKDLRSYLALCGHLVCDNCYTKIFIEKQYTTTKKEICPKCNTQLAKGLLFHRTYADIGLNRYNEVRAQILRVYNLIRSDFNSLDAYNSYLEEREKLIYNLVYDVDVKETNAKIEKYKAEHQDIIASKANKKYTNEELYRMRRSYIVEEHKKLAQMRKLRENMLEDLSYGRIGSQELLLLTDVKGDTPMQEADGASWEQSLADNNTNAKPAAPVADTRARINYTPRAQSVMVAEFQLPKPVTGHQMPTNFKAPNAKQESDREKAKKQVRAGGYKEDVHRNRLLSEAFDGLFVPTDTS